MWYSGCYVLDCVSEYWWGSLALYRIFGTYRRKFYSKSGYCTLALNIQRTNNEMLSRLILNGVAYYVFCRLCVPFHVGVVTPSSFSTPFECWGAGGYNTI